MIISDKYKYIFIETPHTGSTAISKELREKYHGKEILRKHSNYHEFLKIATPAQRGYFVFAAVRNPLDEAVSLYYKFLTDHKANYTNKNKRLGHGGWVTKRKIKIYKMVQREQDFGKFLREFYNRTYTSNINLNHKHCDFVMRFENLEEDFSKALDKLGVTKLRRLPRINKTKDRGGFEDYYKQELNNYAIKIFGPFMKEWSYEFPDTMSGIQINKKHEVKYKLNKKGRAAYSKYIKGGPLKRVVAIRNILE